MPASAFRFDLLCQVSSGKLGFQILLKYQMKRYIALMMMVCLAWIMRAQEAVTLPEGIHFEVRNDTLFVVSEDEGTMPHHVKIGRASCRERV